MGTNLQNSWLQSNNGDIIDRGHYAHCERATQDRSKSLQEFFLLKVLALFASLILIDAIRTSCTSNVLHGTHTNVWSHFHTDNLITVPTDSTSTHNSTVNPFDSVTKLTVHRFLVRNNRTLIVFSLLRSFSDQRHHRH